MAECSLLGSFYRPRVHTGSIGQCIVVFGHGFYDLRFLLPRFLFASSPFQVQLSALVHFVNVAHSSLSVMNSSVKQVRTLAGDGGFSAQGLLLVDEWTPFQGHDSRRSRLFATAF